MRMYLVYDIGCFRTREIHVCSDTAISFKQGTETRDYDAIFFKLMEAAIYLDMVC